MINTQHTRDFPDWIGPMLVKELRQGLKARAFEVAFVFLQVLLASVVAYHALLYAKHGAKFDASGLDGLFWFVVGIQLLVITPVRALGGLTNERKANTLELIFMTGLSAWRIAWGKWASLFFQTILFVLAVLPYGVLRYFFGGVNLVEDLATLGLMLLASAVLSAVALAISGLPMFVRVGAIGLFVFFGMSIVPAILVRMVLSTGAGSLFGSVPFESWWWLAAFNALLICAGALEIGAWTIAPIAENHALRQRWVVLAAWLPIPALKALNAASEMIVAQLLVFIVVALVLSLWHLSSKPRLMRVHLEPFHRRGPLGAVASLFFQPGWPSAVAFLVLVEGIFWFSAGWVFSSANHALEARKAAISAGAAILTPPLITVLLRLRIKQTLVVHAVILALSLGLFTILKTGFDSDLGDSPILALFPPIGFLAMMVDGSDSSSAYFWAVAGSLALIVQAVLLLFLSRRYWSDVRRLGGKIGRARKRDASPLEVAA